MKFLLVGINAKYTHTNLAIRYLKKYAESKIAVNIAMIEFTINTNICEMLSEIYMKKADCVAFSCYIWNIDIVKRLVAEIKLIAPNVKIILGGPEVSYNANEILINCQADYIILGEGEISFVLICSHLQSGNPNLNEIPQISYMNNGEYVENFQGNCINMDDLPFPYDDFTEISNRTIYYESSRGCPFSCQYCLSSIEKGVRFSSISKVFSDLSLFIKQKVRQVKFVDRTFNANKTHALEIVKFLIQNDNKVTNFHFEISSDLLDMEFMELISSSRMNLFQLEIGVQSINPQTLQIIHRNTNLEWLSNCVKILRKNENINIHLDLIAGLPMEDFNSFSKSFDFVYNLHPHQLQLGFLKLLKGSGMEGSSHKYGVVCSVFPPYEVLFTNSLPFSDVLKLKQIEEMVDAFYNSNRFCNSLDYIMNNFASPFEFFYRLAEFKKCNNYPTLTNNKQLPFGFLLDFANRLKFDTIKLQWLLKYDALLHENLRTTPKWFSLETIAANSSRFYEFLTRDPSIFQLLPEYTDVPQMQLQKLIHIEEFPFNPKTLENVNTIFLFNYRKVNLLGHASAINLIYPFK